MQPLSEPTLGAKAVGSVDLSLFAHWGRSCKGAALKDDTMLGYYLELALCMGMSGHGLRPNPTYGRCAPRLCRRSWQQDRYQAGRYP
jgi:hypothetical protein